MTMKKKLDGPQIKFKIEKEVLGMLPKKHIKKCVCFVSCLEPVFLCAW